jgi:hypothetical protein
MSESNQLWRRDTHYHVVEIEVGPTWVEKHRTQGGQEEAERLARIELADRSVTGARIHEHMLSHTCTETFSEQSQPEAESPNKMKPTGKSVACPACGKSAKVSMETGGGCWVSCGFCKKALPVSVKG